MSLNSNIMSEKFLLTSETIIHIKQALKNNPFITESYKKELKQILKELNE